MEGVGSTEEGEEWIWDGWLIWVVGVQFLSTEPALAAWEGGSGNGAGNGLVFFLLKGQGIRVHRLSYFFSLCFQINFVHPNLLYYS